MDKHVVIHLTVLCVVAVVAIVAVAGMFMHGKAGDAPGHNKGLGSLCTNDAQCAEGLSCSGSITLKNGNIIPGINVCT